jgi:type II secretory pathway component PulF
MPTFKYKAKKGPEDIIEASVDAASEKEAIEKISIMGYIPVSIELESKGGGSSSSHQTAAAVLMKPPGRIKSKQITIFSRQLASLLKAGVPILRALNIISEQSNNPNFKAVFFQINRAVKEGATFSSALSKYPAVFSPLYIAMIRTGEDSGSLPQVLLRIAEYRVKDEEMYSRFKMAMVYPVLMMVVGIGTIVFMLTFVLPRLMNIYSTMGQSLPLPTRILIAISTGLREKGGLILIGVAAAIFLFRQQAQTKAGKLAFGAMALRVPVLGALVQKAELARFSRTLELLLKSGLPILRALSISLPVLNNEVIKNYLNKSYKGLEQGGSFAASLRDSRLIPPFMSNLVSVGEESGKIDDALREIADSYEKDTDDSLRISNSLIEPVMMLVMGLIVGFIVMAMLLPIFEMNMMVK